MKNTKIKKKEKKQFIHPNIPAILHKKITYFKKIIQKTILSIQKYKSLDIIGITEINICMESLENLFLELNKIIEIINQKKK